MDEEHQFTGSPNHVHMKHAMEEFTCIHHPVYTVPQTLYEGIGVRIRYIVAPGDNYVILWV